MRELFIPCVAVEVACDVLCLILILAALFVALSVGGSTCSTGAGAGGGCVLSLALLFTLLFVLLLICAALSLPPPSFCATTADGSFIVFLLDKSPNHSVFVFLFVISSFLVDSDGNVDVAVVPEDIAAAGAKLEIFPFSGTARVTCWWVFCDAKIGHQTFKNECYTNVTA